MNDNDKDKGVRKDVKEGGVVRLANSQGAQGRSDKIVAVTLRASIAQPPNPPPKRK
ncbi:MAG: hypothetical protein ACOX9C_04320 [Kiritimatiellia bacterium]|jgi:hypothetical protein